MVLKKAQYITTTLPYVNAEPHIGHALEFIQADTLARYYRQQGLEVFFSTGTDEHGQKIAQKADEAGQARQAYVNHYAGEFNRLKISLNLSYDNFIRTSSPEHKAAAQEMWRRCEAKGDIYKKKYKGLYCVGDEMFVKESDLVDGRCPNHPNLELQEIEEENYFFKLSQYQAYLEEYLSKEGVIVPEWRRQEALNFVQIGLEDFSISREIARMDWGVLVPGDTEQVMYVWFDALTNYVSSLGWLEDSAGNFEKFWQAGETLQLGGKDQVRFQSIMWQAMLKSAELKATDKIFYHGFINSGGQKMSKSLGNVISPYELVARYGTDATRYLLLRHVHPFDDSDLTWEKMDEYYTANLVNGLGNVVARIMKMAESYGFELAETNVSLTLTLQDFNFQGCLDKVWLGIQSMDEYIQQEEPYKKVKVNEAGAKKDVGYLLQQLGVVAEQLIPFMPETAERIKQAVASGTKPENLFPRLETTA